MPVRKDYEPEFKGQAVRFARGEMEPDESREHACERLGPKLKVKAVTLYNWLKHSASANRLDRRQRRQRDDGDDDPYAASGRRVEPATVLVKRPTPGALHGHRRRLSPC